MLPCCCYVFVCCKTIPWVCIIFVTVVTCNCQFLYIYLSKLLHGCVKVVDWFVKVLICISRLLPNKIKLKFDQHFEAAFGLFCLWQYFLTPFLIVPVLVSLFTPSPKSWIAAPDMRHVQSLLLPPAQVFIYQTLLRQSCYFMPIPICLAAVAADAPIQDLIGLSPCCIFLE